MASFQTLEAESIQAGTAGIPPIATVDIWQSLDPTLPFSVQNWGVSNFQGMHNQIGVHNGIGAHILTGLSSLIGFKSQVGGQVHAEPSSNAAAVQMAFSSPQLIQTTPLNATTLFQSGTAVCVAPCSDENAKKNVEPLQNSLNKVLELNGVSFDWREDVVPIKAEKESRQIGLIAQEVEKIVPEVVTDEIVEGQTLKSIRYENLVAILIEGMKEQQEQINSLKETVQELSTKLAECCS